MRTIQTIKPRVESSRESLRGLLTPRAVITATALSLAIGGAVNTYAQEGRGVALEEIVVTATRREEGLQTIPASISAVTAADLADRGIVDFSKVTEAVSGVSLSRPGSAISSGVYVRGVGTAGTSPANQSVGVLVDGVYQLRVGAAFTELMDLDRVEILRGPQGTLFGRNTTAGVIRIFTADPDTEEFSGKIQGVAGNLDAKEVRGLVNIPIIEGKLAARFSGYTAERDGYTENLYTNTDTRNVDREGYRAKLLWDVTDNFQAKLSYEDSNQESNMDLGRVAYTPQLLSLAPQLVNYPVSLGKSQENVGAVSDDVQRTTFNLKWNFLDHTLSTTSAWDEFELFLLDDRDRTPLTSELNGTVLAGGPGRPYFYQLTNFGETESETHEIQLNSEWEGALNYVLGYYVQSEELTSTTSLFSSSGPLPRPPTQNDVDSEAYFGTVFYEFNDQWKASAGVRYTDDQKQGMNSVVSAPWNPAIVNRLAEVKFDEWTYSFKLTNQIDPDLMLYIAHDKGFKSGGINREFSTCGTGPGRRCITPDEATWDPEISYNYELGMKSEWLDNTLRINGALYYQTYEDFQVTQDIQTLSNVVVMNATEVEAMGVEADFLYLLSENLTLNGSVAIGTTEYDDFTNATCTPGTSGCVNGFQDLSGQQLDHAPKLSFNVGGEYRDALANFNDAEWFTRLDMVYKSDQNLHFEQPHMAEQDAYALVNARVGVEGFDGWKVTLWADNLFDEDYLAEAQENLLGEFQIPGIERTYGVTVDYAF